MHLNREVDLLHGQYRVAEGVRHARVELGDDQATAGPDRLDRGGQHVDLDAQRDRPVGRSRCMDAHYVGRQGVSEQMRNQRQPAGEVPQFPLPAHAGADERGLQHDA